MVTRMKMRLSLFWSFFLTVVAVGFLLLLLLLLLLAQATTNQLCSPVKDQNLTIASPTEANTDEEIIRWIPYTLWPAATTPDTFLSFTMDWNLNGSAAADDAWTNASIGWTLDLQSPQLLRLAAALAPANLRVGGGMADEAVYVMADHDAVLCTPERAAKHVCLTRQRWDELVHFCQKANLRLVFTLNIMIGREQYEVTNFTSTTPSKWNSSNAHELLRYTAAKWPHFPHGFELGNEKEHELSAADVASCYRELRSIIDEYWPTPGEGRPILVGPALNIRPDWLALFLSHLDDDNDMYKATKDIHHERKNQQPSQQRQVLDAVTYHLYPGFGNSPNLPQLFPNPAWLDFSHSLMQQMQRASATGPNHLWIGESAAAWNSGAGDGICNGFLSSFWYLDALGHAATTGHQALCRQALVGGNYSLLDQRAPHYRPNPDFWVALLFRRLFGRKVLWIDQFAPGKRDFVPQVRAYASCTPTSAPGYAPGAITVAWVHTGDRSRTIGLFRDETDPTTLVGLPRLDYILTPGALPMDSSNGNHSRNRLQSRQIRLNDKLLELATPNWTLPGLKGRLARDHRLTIPPSSLGFSVYAAAEATACMTRKTDQMNARDAGSSTVFETKQG